MYPAAIFCKSFRDDFAIVRNLVSTREKFADRYPLVISIPSSDLHLLRTSVSLPSQVNIVCDEDYTPQECRKLPGWFQQQICKLSVHKLKLAHSFLAVDSDSYFVAPLDDQHFTRHGAPRIVYSLLETKFTRSNLALISALKNQTTILSRFENPPRGNALGISERINAVKLLSAADPTLRADDKYSWINSIFGVPHEVKFQPGQILHTAILEEMEVYFSTIAMSIYDIIKLSPWEYNWYACYAMTLWGRDVSPAVSPVLHFATDEAVRDAVNLGIQSRDIALHFPVVQMDGRNFYQMAF